MQLYTSAKTSRKQVPALHKALLKAKVWQPGDVNADIGGGKYDLTTKALCRAGVTNLVYDPFNRSESHNQTVLRLIQERATTATVANVLNVIAEPENRAEVIELASQASRVFFTVYEGNKSGVGCATRDGWQENRKLGTYLPEIRRFLKAEAQSLGRLRLIVAQSLA